MMYKRIISVGCFLSYLLFIFSCKQKQTNDTTIHDIAWLKVLKVKYDSLFHAYDTSRKFEYLESAGAFADSAILFGKELLKDTLIRKQYLRFLYVRADDLSQMGNYDKSFDYYLKWFNLYDSLGLEKGKSYFYSAKNLANIYTRYGDYKNAARLLSNALEYSNHTYNKKEILSNSINLAIVLKEKYLFDSAIAVLQRAAKTDTANTRRIIAIYNELAANKMALKDTSASFFYLQKAFELSKTYSAISSENDMSVVFSETYKQFGNLNMRPGKFQEAKKAFHTSLQLSNPYGVIARRRENGKLYNLMGTTCEAIDEIDSALYYYKHALYTVANVDTTNIYSLPEPKNIYAENTIVESLDKIADCMSANCSSHNRQEWLENAAQCYKLSFVAERKLMLNFSYDESKLQMLAASRHRSEKAINICYELYQSSGNETWINRAFSFAEKNKTFVLLEAVKRNLAARTFSNDTLYNKLQEKQMQYAIAEKNTAVAALQKDSVILQQYLQHQKAADDALQSVKNNYSLHNTQYRQWIQEEDSISIFTITALLPDNHTALTEYFIGDSTSYCFIIAKDKLPLLLKLPNTLSAGIANLLRFFNNRNEIVNHPIAYDSAAYRVYSFLQLNKIAKGIERLLIIPDNTIYFIPFDALTTGISSSYNLSSYKYLVRQFEINYSYSATLLLKQKEYSSSGKKAVVFAPLFEQKQRGLSPLPFSRAEAESISRYADADKYTGSNASLDNFRKYAGHAGIIHIAAHAAASDIPRIEFYDSTLYLNEIYAMQLQADIVVLSGCETGIGKVEKSEGSISLARGFCYSGAHSVITSLWSADDNSTAQIFENFYKKVSNDRYDFALHNAKLNYLKPGKNNDKYSPYYWAGFVYIGPSSLLATHKYFTLLIVMIIIITFLFAWKFQRKPSKKA